MGIVIIASSPAFALIIGHLFRDNQMSLTSPLMHDLLLGLVSCDLKMPFTSAGISTAARGLTSD